MHQASIDLMAAELNRYDDSDSERDVNVLDVGSLDINGTYRPLISGKGWGYTGLDIEYGPNVDALVDNSYHYPLGTGQFDVVISGSVAYAVLDLVSWFKEITRVLRPGGLLVVVTPSFTKPPTTSSPVDLWRMSEEALRLLMANTGVLDDIRTVESHHDVCASAIRVHGEIDEPKSHEFAVHGGEPTVGSSTKSVTVKPKAKPTARKAIKK